MRPNINIWYVKPEVPYVGQTLGISDLLGTKAIGQPNKPRRGQPAYIIPNCKDLMTMLQIS